MTIQSFTDCAPVTESDIVIVGAGISGLYCAYRIAMAQPEATITIVERLDRTGGRLDTDIVRIKKHQTIREEEGGMRFNYDMTELMRLTCALGLCEQIVPFPMGSNDDTNRFHVRGHSFTVAEAAAGGQMIWSELYDLAPDEIGLSPTELVTRAYRNILYANGAAYLAGRQPEFWQRFREEFTWKDTALCDWQLWGLLRDMGYSEECIAMLSETIGFAGPFKSLANAGDALQILADFPKNPTYFTFQRGFSTLPDAVVAWLNDSAGERVQILLSTNVDRITDRDGGGYDLTVTAARGGDANPFTPSGETRTLRCRKLILAAAARGLETLFITSPALNGRTDARTLWENIHAALGMKLMKINLYFDHPWWLDGQTGRPPIQYGPSFSSLPINAVYPFYSLRRLENPDPTPREHAAAALTIYCDFDNTNFWRGLQGIGPKFTSPLQEEHNAEGVMFPASEAVVAEARKQIGALFGTSWVPEPILTSYRLWDGEDDFEFAYHQWRVGVRDGAVMDYLAAPREDLSVCNEAFSDMQGWVNGSLRSANRALAHFGISPMDGANCTDDRKDITPQPLFPRMGLWGG
jgi:hypothetical protein